MSQHSWLKFYSYARNKAGFSSLFSVRGQKQDLTHARKWASPLQCSPARELASVEPEMTGACMDGPIRILGLQRDWKVASPEAIFSLWLALAILGPPLCPKQDNL